MTNIESLYYIKYGEKIKLSEQQLIDCDTNNDGCKGGLMTTAYDYIMKVGGLMLVNYFFFLNFANFKYLNQEKDYPYADKKQDCKFDKSKAVVNIQGYVRLTQNPQEMTKALVKIGPLEQVETAVSWTLIKVEYLIIHHAIVTSLMLWL